MRTLLALLALVGTATAVQANSNTASMSVAVSVVRSCAVSSHTDTVTLACSGGVSRVSLGTATADVRPIVSGSNTLSLSGDHAGSGVVTIHF